MATLPASPSVAEPGTGPNAPLTWWDTKIENGSYAHGKGFGANSSGLISVAKTLRKWGDSYYPSGKCRADYQNPYGLIGDAPTLGMETVEVKRARKPTASKPKPAPAPQANEPDSSGVNWRYEYELAVVTVKLLRSAVARLQGELERKGVALSPEMQHEFDWLGFEHGRDTRTIELITA